MKANLLLKNIGGIKEGKYVFDSEKLNIVESANSSGKTSIVKGLTGILSMPKNGVFSEIAFDEALKLGVKTDPHNPFEGFVNIYADEGRVELEFDNLKDQYVVKQNGSIQLAPKQGDERFLLAGILSNNSRVLRQLRGLDRREPDDFRWAVEELSNAQRYATIEDTIKSWLEDFQDKQEIIKKNLNELRPLLNQQIDIETKLGKLDLEINTLTEKLSGARIEISKLVQERNQALMEVNRLKDAVQKAEVQKTTVSNTELTPKLRELETEESRKKQIELKLKQAKEQIATLSVKEKRKSEIENDVNSLLERRSFLDGMLNLYLMAEASIKGKQNGKVGCPLCKVGNVSYNEIIQNIADYRKQRESLNSQILILNQEKQTMAIQLIKSQDLEKSLTSSLVMQQEKLGFINRQISKPQEAIRQLDSLLEKQRKNLKSAQVAFDEIDKIVSNQTDFALNREFEEKNKTRSNLFEEKGTIRHRIGELSAIEILGRVFEPEVAQSVCAATVNILKDRIEFLEKRAQEEREQAANRFNENVTYLLKSLSFQEFRTVRLTGSPNYRLYVERFDPQKKDYKSQEVGTLSTSEKLAISIILQIALKETYLKNLPFMLIDDVLEDFDTDRLDRVIQYLKEKVVKEGWFIIVTRLVKEHGPPRIRYL